MDDLLGRPKESRNNSTASFNAHLIFHGPKLKMLNAGSDTVRKNDFLGEATSSSFDTHLFEGESYEAALIQREKELHLYLRSKENGVKEANLISLIDCVSRATSFTLGFHPWPIYHEFRKDHRIVERWLSPRLNLRQTFLAPISNSLWSSLRERKEESFHRIIPIIADGLRALPKTEREKLNQLLWHFRCGEFGALSHSMVLLIICTILEGLTKLITGVSEDERHSAQDVWKAAMERLNLSWDRWGKEYFELWRDRRNQLAHGWVFISDDELEGFNEDHLSTRVRLFSDGSCLLRLPWPHYDSSIQK